MILVLGYEDLRSPVYVGTLFLDETFSMQDETEHMYVIPCCRKLNLTITVYPLSMMKWQFYAAQGMKKNWSVHSVNKTPSPRSTYRFTQPYSLYSKLLRGQVTFRICT